MIGYSGDSCVTASVSISGAASPVILGLIITLMVITGLLVSGIVLVFRQINAYRDDVENYRALRGNDVPSEVTV